MLCRDPRTTENYARHSGENTDYCVDEECNCHNLPLDRENIVEKDHCTLFRRDIYKSFFLDRVFSDDYNTTLNRSQITTSLQGYSGFWDDMMYPSPGSPQDSLNDCFLDSNRTTTDDMDDHMNRVDEYLNPNIAVGEEDSGSITMYKYSKHPHRATPDRCIFFGFSKEFQTMVSDLDTLVSIIIVMLPN